LSHTVHRHEPAVAVSSPDPPLYGTVLHETETVIIINKPATIPVHPCGGYHVQSLMNILETHYHQKLYTIHRLDRLTSGLVILAKTSTVAQQWSKRIMNRDCQKVYLARVQGRFPYNCPRNLTRLVIPASAAAGFVDVPWYGEWNNYHHTQDDATITPPPVRTAVAKHLETKKRSTVTDLRKQYAHVYWIANEHDNVLGGDEKDETSARIGLSEIFEPQRSVDEWLQSLERGCKWNGNSNNNGGSCSTTTTNESPHSCLWFHLACPTRIAQHKDGICEAGKFDTLSDDHYQKTVKPAASAFGVVSYDRNTDSTLLVRTFELVGFMLVLAV
jgi:hypothetical protein